MWLLFQFLCSFRLEEVAESDRRSEGLCDSFLVNRWFRLNCQVLSRSWKGGGERDRMGLQVETDTLMNWCEFKVKLTNNTIIFILGNSERGYLADWPIRC